MSHRSESPSDEGQGDDIRPHGDIHDSSEESEDDLAELAAVKHGFIVDDEEAEVASEDDEEARAARKAERRKRKRRERQRRQRDEVRLSDDELDLINENMGLAGPSRPVKRARGRSGSVASNDRFVSLQDMFREDERGDDDDDDMGDFIEEDYDDEAVQGETEEERRERRREEKRKRKEAAKIRPEMLGVDSVSWDEEYAVFGDGHDYDWALEGDEAMDEDEYEETKKDLRLEDVFDPAEIKERLLLDEDKAIAQNDKPERHQLLNSTLSDNPVLAPESLYPPPGLAAGWAYNKISYRTQYLFCGMHEEGAYPLPSIEDPTPYPRPRRSELAAEFTAAVSKALDMMFVQNYEVPYLWHYKRDVLGKLEDQGRSFTQFLERDELWQLHTLGIRFRAIYERTEQAKAAWEKIKVRRPDVEDSYLTKTLLPSVCMLSIESAAEAMEWLAYHYSQDLRAIKEEESIEEGGKRPPERSGFDDLRHGPVMQLVKAFGVSVNQVATTFNEAEGSPVPPTNPDKMPLDLAAEYAGEGTPFLTGESALKAASQILTTEFSKDPSIRQQAREFMEYFGVVTVNPTERGISVIDQYHLYYTFKFLTRKPIAMFKDSPQFLHMLKAEEEGLINIVIEIPEADIQTFADPLVRCCRSMEYGEVATAWNEMREEICQDVVSKLIMPAAARWVKEHMRLAAEEYVAERCRMELEFRVNVRPFATPDMEQGETPTVLAISNGRGDIKDAVIAVMLDDGGNIRSQSKFDNLKDEAEKSSFIDMVERRKPSVVVIGGLSAQTGRVRDDAMVALRELAAKTAEARAPLAEAYSSHEEYAVAAAEYEARIAPHLTPLVFVNDATARLYMRSEEAEKEYPTMPVNGRYALALARYAQNPLNAHCKLGKRITSITFQEHHQKLIPEEKLLIHLERGLVNSVCFMGIEVNSCVADPYQRSMLPFIAGLGPRKADALINGIQRHGALVNRDAFAALGLLGPTNLVNAPGFLSIETDLKDIVLDEKNATDAAEPLDMTRIHPDDYDFARKMCQDALDLDAEDVEDEHKSAVVLKLMLDEDRAAKMAELNLDDFAWNLQRQGEGVGRHTLGMIVAELISYRADRRPPFYIPTEWEVIQMLTGETERTIGRGLLVTATVRKALTSRVFCALECGMDAILERDYVADEDQPISSCEDLFTSRQAIRAVVISTEPSRLQVRISTRPSDVRQAVPFLQPFRDDPYNDLARKHAAEEAAQHKKRREAGSVKRVVNHPNWHVMNSGQAEQFLASQQRGDVVIRPSSKGSDHLAVTWKVDEDVYQHIDVQEIDKPNEYSLGRILRVAGKYSYSDLDELIINHVKAIARKIDEMQMHEKYRPEDELEAYLKNYVQAHPGRSMYGFSLDSDRPGYLKLCFLNKSTKDGGVIQTWPVKVLPGAYQLNNAEVPGVTELCNAFKAQYSSRLSEQGQGGKTPGIRSARTPMIGGRTPGGRTPALGMTGGRTPALGGGMRDSMPPAGYPGYPNVPNYPTYPPQPSHFQPPPPNYNQPPPPMTQMGPPGMNPERAAMLARQGRY
ncbi:hypothetical protein TREMEDRAFT_71488 [Tremella mesenterica DSM 1558]|uniref:uncharacterized protein n=1 Tax=Tremella mesenterica (strain ATCC 24925 / CBS 8224 / DSM 1558 / NBRC 9311 / NRRL Y-6157 / RJB 2259-6 / UBC 559-6) TaxID=578456 RepID=UPI0003F496E4|nr:uncharacterized protein TREMEDRAFT_71488 [Tremella mesenterica DSM 1558]EIW70012.1 hypothetical protein TREMEDRAFT_71488 [Tremella mesenterica DSM 1558]